MTNETTACTPVMVLEQIARIGLYVRMVDMKDWSEPMCTEAFMWATEVDTARTDGGKVSVRARPDYLTAAIIQAAST